MVKCNIFVNGDLVGIMELTPDEIIGLNSDPQIKVSKIN